MAAKFLSFLIVAIFKEKENCSIGRFWDYFFSICVDDNGNEMMYWPLDLFSFKSVILFKTVFKTHYKNNKKTLLQYPVMNNKDVHSDDDDPVW